jgi:hypothetical protein
MNLFSLKTNPVMATWFSPVSSARNKKRKGSSLLGKIFTIKESVLCLLFKGTVRETIFSYSNPSGVMIRD